MPRAAENTGDGTSSVARLSLLQHMLESIPCWWAIAAVGCLWSWQNAIVMGLPVRHLRRAAARSTLGRSALLAAIGAMALALADAPAWSRSGGHAAGHHANE